jgi:hypothetical protein
MYRYFYGIVLAAFVFVSVATEDCGEYMSTVIGIAAQQDLRKSTDKGVQAAGASAEALNTSEAAKAAEGRALNANNLRKAENMDFTDIDNLIKSQSWEDKYYLQKAAMQVAANKPGSAVNESTGQALTIIKGKNSSGQEQETIYRFMGELGNVQTGLVKGTTSWNRVHSELCAQQALYKSYKSELYSEFTQTRINAALADAPC